MYGTIATKREDKEEKCQRMSSHHLKMVIEVIRLGVPLKPLIIRQPMTTNIVTSSEQPRLSMSTSTTTIKHQDSAINKMAEAADKALNILF